jgi:hypothetical protein
MVSIRNFCSRTRRSAYLFRQVGPLGRKILEIPEVTVVWIMFADWQ